MNGSMGATELYITKHEDWLQCAMSIVVDNVAECRQCCRTMTCQIWGPVRNTFEDRTMKIVRHERRRFLWTMSPFADNVAGQCRWTTMTWQILRNNCATQFYSSEFGLSRLVVVAIYSELRCNLASASGLQNCNNEFPKIRLKLHKGTEDKLG